MGSALFKKMIEFSFFVANYFELVLSTTNNKPFFAIVLQHLAEKSSGFG